MLVGLFVVISYFYPQLLILLITINTSFFLLSTVSTGATTTTKKIYIHQPTPNKAVEILNLRVKGKIKLLSGVCATIGSD